MYLSKSRTETKHSRELQHYNYFLELTTAKANAVSVGEKIVLFLLLVMLSSFLVTTAYAAEPDSDNREIVRACFLEWGKQGGKDLPEQGFNPDLVSTVLREAGYEPVVDIIPWVRCVELTKKKKYDIIAGYWRGKEGDKYFDYFRPTTIDKINFIVLRDSPYQSGKIENMRGARVGYLKGAGGLETFRAANDKMTQVEASNDKALIKMLKNRRIEAIASNSPHITSLAEVDFPEIVDDLKVLQPPIQQNIASPAISLSHPKLHEMKAMYNKAYDKLVSEGLYERLMEKHKIRVDYTMD